MPDVKQIIWRWLVGVSIPINQHYDVIPIRLHTSARYCQHSRFSTSSPSPIFQISQYSNAKPQTCNYRSLTKGAM